MSVRSPAQKKIVTFLDLLERKGVIIPAVVSIHLTSSRMRDTYEVTGMSPQSSTLAQELNGFAFNGTLYPPLNPILREPLCPSGRKVSSCCLR